MATLSTLAKSACDPTPTNLSVARPLLPTFEALEPYIRRIDANRWYANLGPLALELEARLALRFKNPARVVSAVNGTQAMVCALRALSAPEGLCLMPAWTFVATPHAAVQAGLTPFFLDVDPQSWMLDPAAVKDALKRVPGPVAAVVPVSAFGRPMDLSAWAAFKDDTGVPVIVDAAAGFDGLDQAPVPVAVSLHATKALGVGEGGFVASEDAHFAARVREQTNFGFRAPRLAEAYGTNAKLSEHAAAIGHAALDAWPHTRATLLRAAQAMRVALLERSDIVFQPGWGSQWISTTCVVELPSGGAAHVAERLAREQVETRQWWGQGCHRHPAFASLARSSLPVSENLAVSTLGLPFLIDMDEAQLQRLAGAILDTNFEADPWS